MLSSILSQALSNRISLNFSSYQTVNICLKTWLHVRNTQFRMKCEVRSQIESICEVRSQMCIFCYLLFILRHLSVNNFATKYLFFAASFDVTVESQCITYVTVDLVCIDFQPFCINECIGPESFSAWNLLWHHQIYCFRALRHGTEGAFVDAARK
jgi:hypothetical protein